MKNIRLSELYKLPISVTSIYEGKLFEGSLERVDNSKVVVPERKIDYRLLINIWGYNIQAWNGEHIELVFYRENVEISPTVRLTA